MPEEDFFMKKTQIRCIIGNALVHIAGIMTLCFFVLNMIEGAAKNSIYGAITNLATVGGASIGFYITSGAFYILTLILSIVMIILSAIGLFGGIFDVRALNMTTANRTLSIINMISALMALIFMIVYVAVAGVGASVGAGPITVFLTSILAVVGAFVAYDKKIYSAK